MQEVIQTVNVSATLRAMEVGGETIFDSSINENTLRNACVRLRATGVGTWSVDKRNNPICYYVTRTA